MPELNLNLSSIVFDETGKVKITDPSLTNVLEGLFDASDAVSSSSNNGCGNSANSGCGNNGSCAESSAIFKKENVILSDNNEVLINNYEFSKAILRAKIQGEETMSLKVSSLND